MCEKWIHGRCVKIKKVTPKMAKDFVCKKCRKSSKEKVKTIKIMCNEIETINEFGMKMMYRKNTNELIDMLRFDESMDKMAKVNRVIWYGHILRREDNNVL